MTDMATEIAARTKPAQRDIICARLTHLLWGADLLGTRTVIGVASLVWALSLVWPASGGLFPSASGEMTNYWQAIYVVMGAIMTEGQWAVLFATHGVIAITSVLYGLRTRTFLLMFEGVLGCSLWTTSTIACYMAAFNGWAGYRPPAILSADVIVTLGAWWVLVRYRVRR